MLIVPSGPPCSFSASLTSDTSLILAWDPPEEHHRNGEITGYVIKYQQTSTSSAEEMITVGGDVRELELNDVGTGVTYRFTIAAQTINGSGPFAAILITVEGRESVQNYNFNLCTNWMLTYY